MTNYEKAILVTGGAGFIGSNFILYMLNRHPECRIVNIDKLTYSGNLENLKNVGNRRNYTFVQGDICDKSLVEKLFEIHHFCYIVNFAAESHVDRSIANPEIFVRTNILGTTVLLNSARECWRAENGFKDGVKFLQISTDEVYGSLGKTGYFTEATPIDPHSPYSSSKAAADLIVKAYYDTYGMPINITRCSNNYGPYQFPEKLIPLMINNALSGKSLFIYGDGLNIRDWLYVEDHCTAIELVLFNGKTGDIYNIGGQNEYTNIQVVKTILGYLHDHIDLTIDESLVTFVEDRKGHDRRYAIDASKIRKDLGWLPKTHFEKGIIKTTQWYIDNKSWLKDITSGEYKNYYDQFYVQKFEQEKKS